MNPDVGIFRARFEQQHLVVRLLLLYRVVEKRSRDHGAAHRVDEDLQDVGAHLDELARGRFVRGGFRCLGGVTLRHRQIFRSRLADSPGRLLKRVGKILLRCRC